jgi:hypothetical protein
MKLPIKISKRIILYAGAAAVIAGLLSNFVFIALGKRLKGLNNRIRLSEAELRQILEISKAKDVVTLEYRTYKPYLEAEKWDEKKAVEELLKEVERIAREARVSVINLSPQPLPEMTKECKKYKADLRIDASLNEIFSFLRGVEASGLLINVEKFVVASKSEDGSLFKSEMTIALAIPQ